MAAVPASDSTTPANPTGLIVAIIIVGCLAIAGLVLAGITTKMAKNAASAGSGAQGPAGPQGLQGPPGPPGPPPPGSEGSMLTPQKRPMFQYSMNKVSYVSGAGNIPFDIPTYINDCNVALLTNPAAPGVFTIPMTGSYLINYSVNTQGSGQLITSLKRNGSIMAIAYASPVAVNSFWPSNGTYIGNLLQNDTINIQYEAKLAPGWTSLTLLGYSFIQVTYIGPYVGPYVPPPAPAPAFA